METEVTSAAVSTPIRTASEFPPPPPSTNSWLLTTDYKYSRYYNFCLLLATYKKHGSVGQKIRTHLLSRGLSVCRVITRTRAVKNEQSHQEQPNTVRDQLRLPGLPDCLRKYTHNATHTTLPRPRELRGVVPLEGYTTQTQQNPVTYVFKRYCLIKYQENYDDSSSRDVKH